MNARDAALLTRWSEHRDAEAFNDLVSHYADMVYATCKRTLGNPADAEELTQECFLRLATGNVRIRTSLGGWLHSAATSLSINRLRSDNRRRKREEIAAAEIPATTEPAWNDIQRFVDQAIAELPEDLRDPLIRHFLQRETHDQIAHDLGLTRSAVTKRIANGIERVRETLKKSGVLLTTATLTALASEHLAEAAPAALKAALGRIALSGVAQAATVAATGMTLLTKIVVAAVIIVTAGAGATMTYHRLEPSQIPASQQQPAAAALKAVVAETKHTQDTVQPAPSTPAAVSESNAVTVSGRVYDKDTLEGIPGAKVYLNLGDIFHLKAQTNERGEYRIDDVQAATWRAACTEANGYYIGGESGNGLQSSRELKLRRGHSATGVDFALGRGEGVTGVAVDAAGKPVAGAKVTAFARINNYHIVNTAESREDGTFLVTGFPPTVALYVWADKGGLVSIGCGPYVLPQVGRALEPIVLQPEAVVRGAVRDKLGKALAGVEVHAAHALSGGKGYGRVFEVVSGADGRFELKGLPSGDIALSVKGREVLDPPYTFLVVAAGQVMENFELTCSSGRLTISGQVVNARGIGLPEALVQCAGASVQTKGDGTFIINNLEPGTYTLTAMHQKYLTSERMDIAAGTANVRLVMPDGISIEGRVIDADTGKPVPSYEVKLSYFPEAMILDDGYVKNEIPDGTFKFSAGLLDNIRIAARAEGYLLGYVDVPADGSQAVVRDKVIRLKPQSGDVWGRVHDAKGTPIVGALVFSGQLQQKEDAYASARTGEGGKFVLPKRKLGDDLIMVHHPNFGTGEATLEQKHYDGEPIDVTIPSGISLACTVLVNGALFEGARVSIFNQSRTPERGKTGPDGKCLIGGVPPGEYIVQSNLPAAPGEGEAMQQKTVTLVAGQTTELVVEFAQGDASISGKVEPPLMPAHIELTVASAQGEQRFIQVFQRARGDDSCFSFSNLPAGEATMEAILHRAGSEAVGQIERHYKFTLTPGVAIQQDINLNEGDAFWGILGPISSMEWASVSFYFGKHSLEDLEGGSDHKDFCASTHVAADGIFRMGGFQPGTYTLVGEAYPQKGTMPEQVRNVVAIVELGAQGQEVNLQLP
ncbi:MAG: sigma-70 family RNA polymerase sigma factor [FCB group bacterium]|jgi:RNA polymerase sigma factor (sigma-70 family)|nr:sigma-70 family RNA polymerase sigma factor [FCB group bacterium]